MMDRSRVLTIMVLSTGMLLARSGYSSAQDGGKPAATNPMTDLHAAAQKGQLDVVKARLAAGDPVDVRGPRDMTPLHFAAVAGKVEVAGLLLDRGADPNARAAGDMTPLHFAAMLAHPEAAGLLARRGARTDALNASGMRPLHLAANEKVVNVLFSAGADINAFTTNGLTPLHTARQGLVARALIEHQADLRIRNPKGRTAMEIAGIETFERVGLTVHSAMLGRLRGLVGQMRVTLTNISAEPIRDISLPAQSEACEIDVEPTSVPELLPGQNADFVWTMTRRVDVPEGEYFIQFSVMSEGKKLAADSLKVDTHKGITPEDQGMIRLAKGQIRPAPARWFYLIYALAPLLVVAAWYFLRKRNT